MGMIAALSAAGLATGLALTGAPTASAATVPDDGVLHQRLEAFCTRVPQLVERAEQARPRLAGDAGTKGSLEWLKARVEKAEGEQRQAAVRRLERRLERRTQRAERLPERIEKLKQAQAECTASGLGTSK
jgi:chromosome segregation ATPase